jgi:hypothetical protein
MKDLLSTPIDTLV